MERREFIHRSSGAAALGLAAAAVAAIVDLVGRGFDE